MDIITISAQCTDIITILNYHIIGVIIGGMDWVDMKNFASTCKKLRKIITEKFERIYYRRAYLRLLDRNLDEEYDNYEKILKKYPSLPALDTSDEWRAEFNRAKIIELLGVTSTKLAYDRRDYNNHKIENANVLYFRGFATAPLRTGIVMYRQYNISPELIINFNLGEFQWSRTTNDINFGNHELNIGELWELFTKTEYEPRMKCSVIIEMYVNGMWVKCSYIWCGIVRNFTKLCYRREEGTYRNISAPDDVIIYPIQFAKSLDF